MTIRITITNEHGEVFGDIHELSDIDLESTYLRVIMLDLRDEIHRAHKYFKSQENRVTS